MAVNLSTMKFFTAVKMMMAFSRMVSQFFQTNTPIRISPAMAAMASPTGPMAINMRERPKDRMIGMSPAPIAVRARNLPPMAARRGPARPRPAPRSPKYQSGIAHDIGEYADSNAGDPDPKGDLGESANHKWMLRPQGLVRLPQSLKPPDNHRHVLRHGSVGYIAERRQGPSRLDLANFLGCCAKVSRRLGDLRE